jgi:hypothetical protein
MNLNDPRSATQRGFGPMWSPNTAPRNDMVPLAVGGIDKIRTKVFIGGVHPALRHLMQLVVDEALRRGYKLTPEEYGFAWRAVRDSNPPRPSNHSSGCAIDINSAHNYLGRSDGGDVPKWMVELFNTYGFRWGGDYSDRKDPMHWEFMGDRDDARRLTDKAKRDLTEGDDVALNENQKDALEFAEGVMRFAAGEPEPKDPGPRRRGYRWAADLAAGTTAP